MDIYKKSGNLFLRPDVPIITETVTDEMSLLLKKHRHPFIIDMNGVESCTNKFFFLFKSYDITLINTTSLLLSTIYMTGFDKFVKIYEEFVSFEDNRRELINRRLCIV